MLLNKLNTKLVEEAQRRGSLGIISQSIGALMLDHNGEVVQREHILKPDGTVIEENNMVTFDQKTGLLMPNPLEVCMLLADGITNVEIPSGFFVHPVTCRLLQIEGSFLLYLNMLIQKWFIIVMVVTNKLVYGFINKFNFKTTVYSYTLTKMTIFHQTITIYSGFK